MSQSSTLFIGMDVHKDSIAVAYVAQDHGAEVMYLGAIGTRQCDIDQLVRKMQSKAKHLIFVTKPAPVAIGSTGISRNKATTPGRRPLLDPQEGRRPRQNRPQGCGATRPLGRSGDLTAVYVPTVEDEPCAISPGPAKMSSAISRTPSSV